MPEPYRSKIRKQRLLIDRLTCEDKDKVLYLQERNIDIIDRLGTRTDDMAVFQRKTSIEVLRKATNLLKKCEMKTK